MGTLLISKIREEYPDRMMMTFSVVPSPKVRWSEAWAGLNACAPALGWPAVSCELTSCVLSWR